MRTKDNTKRNSPSRKTVIVLFVLFTLVLFAVGLSLLREPSEKARWVWDISSWVLLVISSLLTLFAALNSTKERPGSVFRRRRR